MKRLIDNTLYLGYQLHSMVEGTSLSLVFALAANYLLYRLNGTNALSGYATISMKRAWFPEKVIHQVLVFGEVRCGEIQIPPEDSAVAENAPLAYPIIQLGFVSWPGSLLPF